MVKWLEAQQEDVGWIPALSQCTREKGVEKSKELAHLILLGVSGIQIEINLTSAALPWTISSYNNHCLGQKNEHYNVEQADKVKKYTPLT